MASPVDVSICIPARNEFYHDLDLLSHTVTNVLANTSETCEIVVVLDGYDSKWPPQPLPVNPRITVIQHDKSIGQRAACNEAVRVARGKWICKLDAHCAVGPAFDTLMAEHCDYLTTLIPVQYNLHAFSWKCKQCQHETYQGPKPAKCGKCGSRYSKIIVKWQPRGWKERDGVWEGRPKTTSWRFDSDLHFQYWGELARRYPPDQKLTPTMSFLGACFMLHRERYWELDGMDEQMGSWGNQATELACKSHLSGGQVLVNHHTWFAHLFRTQQGFSFPYPNPGKDRAVARSREIWLNNLWPGQVYPLSWLLEKFWPIPDWSVEGNAVFENVRRAGDRFKPSALASRPMADSATGTLGSSLDAVVHRVSTLAVTPSTTPNVVSIVGNKSDVRGVAARLIVADDVIQNRDFFSTTSGQGRNEPSVHESMSKLDTSVVLNMPVSPLISGANPDPAVLGSIADDTRENNLQSSSVLVSHDQHLGHGLIIPRKPRMCALLYTCNSHDETLELAARANLRRATNGHELGCVALQRTDFGDWTVVLNREKGPATMHYQILAGLERSRADYVFFCESDVLYHRTHFEFIPERDDTIYYNTNVWRVRYTDGHAVRTANLQQVSGICANRELLLAHYKRRVALIEANGGVFDVKHMAYEPGTRGKFGDERIANWQSPYPNLDITGHGQTLTTPHFSVDSFRNKKYAEGWQETDEALPGWPKIAGRVQEWLRELADGNS